MAIKSFDEYFEGYKNYDDGGELDKLIVVDAKKVFETLKTPEAIEAFYKANFEERQKMVEGLDLEYSGSSFYHVCHNAQKYAAYAQKYVKEIVPQENAEQKAATTTKEDLIKALDGVEYDKSVVLDMIDKHPDIVKMLADTKDINGKPMFDALAIDDVLFNCKDTIEQHPDRIAAILNNPEEIASISVWKNRGAGLWRAIGDPLSSTIKMNPEVFGMKPQEEQMPKKAGKPKEAEKDTAKSSAIFERISRLKTKIDKRNGKKEDFVTDSEAVVSNAPTPSKPNGRGGGAGR